MPFRSGLAFVLASSPAQAGDGAEAPTFARDVAPILFSSCAPCHRPAGSAPFPLLSRDEAARHARQIVTATRKRRMPPWLPAPGHGEFAGDRRLEEREIETLKRWAAAGAPEGEPSELPPVPEFRDGWQLGTPDLVVTMEPAFVVPAEGRDLLRNFVMPVRTPSPRWVRAIEMRFDDARVVHHATLQIDETGGCARLDERDPEPGFAGMSMGPSRQAGGHFVSFTPGKLPEPFVDGTSWRLLPGHDLVLQLHLVPTGRPAPVRASIGLHFTVSPPTRTVYSLVLREDEIDIPPGARDFVAEESFTLPVDAEAVRIYPHAHYLGREMVIAARRPNGGTTPLLRIDDWDFNWQDSYTYARPVLLERGSTITMRYVYDNSDGNPRNPSRPPVRVRLGNESSDEMGSFTLELLLASPADRRTLVEAFERRNVERQPDDPAARYNLALVLAELGRAGEAVEEYRAVVRLDPQHVPARINLANLFRRRGRHREALALYEEALRIEPRSALTLHNLGTALLSIGETERGIARLEQAVALRPELLETHLNLALAHEELARHERALAEFEIARLIEPRNAFALAGVARGMARCGRLDEAVAAWEEARRLDPGDAAAPDPLEVADVLSAALAAAGRTDEAIAQIEEALARLDARGGADRGPRRADLEARLARLRSTLPSGGGRHP